jgi:nucleoside 2-deoxyribosyltransferase
MEKLPLGYFKAEKCLLTGKSLELTHFDGEFGNIPKKAAYQWYYPNNTKILMIVDQDLYEDKEFWEINKTSIYFLLENEIWPGGKMVDKQILEALISSSGVPISPLEKIKEILFYISITQKHFGEWYSLNSTDYQSIARKLGLFNSEEFEGLIREASNHGFLEIKTEHKQGMTVILSLKGWELADQRNHGKKSNSAFVAMSFDSEMIKVFNDWIRPAIEECGFVAKIALDDPIKSDQTVNDAILAGIKSAKFTIADFTHHRNGVYFEAGYALGRGQNVIYSCKENDIGSAHFDTRNYQHIVWKDGADLKRKLIDKIEVFIKA